MPAADTPFVIGVIREKEKGLLEDDEYTRIIQAPTVSEAYQALMDTPYGVYFATDSSPYEAIAKRLESEMEWLRDAVLDKQILSFIQARYDALHIAQALLDFQAGKENALFASQLGSITAELLTSTIWHDTGWDSLPAMWRTFVRDERSKIKTAPESFSSQELLERVESVFHVNVEKLATSELTRAIAQLEQERRLQEQSDRPDNLPDDISAVEKGWDEKLLVELRRFRGEPTDGDAIIAWWFALAMEARTLRLLLSAKAGGLTTEQLVPLQRSLYRSWV